MRFNLSSLPDCAANLGVAELCLLPEKIEGGLVLLPWSHGGIEIRLLRRAIKGEWASLSNKDNNAHSRTVQNPRSHGFRGSSRSIALISWTAAKIMGIAFQEAIASDHVSHRLRVLQVSILLGAEARGRPQRAPTGPVNPRRPWRTSCG